jgi:hypothetical protein
MKQITTELIKGTHEKMWSELVKRHKTMYAVPFDEIMRVNEVLRGLNVLMAWQNEGGMGRTPMGILSAYSVTGEAVDILVKELQISAKVIEMASEKSEKRKNRWGAFEDWAKENRGKEFLTEQLVEKSGFSYQTTLKHISESPIFTKVKKGIWKVASAERD